MKIIYELVRLANMLDKKNLKREAEIVDNILKQATEEKSTGILLGTILTRKDTGKIVEVIKLDNTTDEYELKPIGLPQKQNYKFPATALEDLVRKGIWILSEKKLCF